MRILISSIGVALLALAFMAPALRAQTQGGSASIAAAVQPIVNPLFTGSSVNAGASLQASAPDTRLLTGAQDFTPDTGVTQRSFWQPFFNFTGSLDTNPLGVGNSTSVSLWGSGYGGMDLHLRSRRSDFTLNYLGGGVFSQIRAEDAPIQELGFGERLSWRHATLSFFDRFSFLPQSVSEFYLPSRPDLPGNQETALQAAFLPNMSIFTTQGQQLTNSAVGELDTWLSQRSSVTFLGSYSLVRFFNADFFDLNDTAFQAGFNRQVTRNNSLALLYRFDAYRFSNVSQSMDGHVLQLAFGRNITGRMAFRVAAGPELGVFSSAASQQPAAAAPASTDFRQLYWTLDSSMTYRVRRTAVRFGYDRSLSDGAGFLAGAVTDAVYGSIDGRLSPSFAGQLTGGYARNEGVLTTAQQASNEIYRDWFAGATISHGLGRWTTVFLSYQVQRQAANFACTSSTCGNNFTRHVISIGLTSRPQPHHLG